MAQQDLTQILTLHNHMQTLDGQMQKAPTNATYSEVMAKEYDQTMERLVQLMGEAARSKLC